MKWIVINWKIRVTRSAIYSLAQESGHMRRLSTQVFTEIALSLVPLINAPSWVKALWVEKELEARGLWRDDVFELVRPFLLTPKQKTTSEPKLRSAKRIDDLDVEDRMRNIVVSKPTLSESERNQQAIDEQESRPPGSIDARDFDIKFESLPSEFDDNEDANILDRSVPRHDLSAEEAELASVMHMIAVSARGEAADHQATNGATEPSADDLAVDEEDKLSTAAQPPPNLKLEQLVEPDAHESVSGIEPNENDAINTEFDPEQTDVPGENDPATGSNTSTDAVSDKSKVQPSAMSENSSGSDSKGSDNTIEIGVEADESDELPDAVSAVPEPVLGTDGSVIDKNVTENHEANEAVGEVIRPDSETSMIAMYESRIAELRATLHAEYDVRVAEAVSKVVADADSRTAEAELASSEALAQIKLEGESQIAEVEARLKADADIRIAQAESRAAADAEARPAEVETGLKAEADERVTAAEASAIEATANAKIEADARIAEAHAGAEEAVLTARTEADRRISKTEAIASASIAEIEKSATEAEATLRSEIEAQVAEMESKSKVKTDQIISTALADAKSDTDDRIARAEAKSLADSDARVAEVEAKSEALKTQLTDARNLLSATKSGAQSKSETRMAEAVKAAQTEADARVVAAEAKARADAEARLTEFNAKATAELKAKIAELESTTEKAITKVKLDADASMAAAEKRKIKAETRFKELSTKRNASKKVLLAEARAQVKAEVEAAAVKADEWTVAEVANRYGLNLDGASDEDRAKLQFFSSIIKSEQGNWALSRNRLREAIKSFGDTPRSLMWRCVIEQSISIHERINKTAA